MDMIKKIEKNTSATLAKIADPGVFLVVSKKDGSCNVMTIGWGLIVFFGPSQYSWSRLDVPDFRMSS